MSKADRIKIVKADARMKNFADGSYTQLYNIVDEDGEVYWQGIYGGKEEAEQELLKIQADVRAEEEEEAMEAARHYISPTAKIIRFPFIVLGYIVAVVIIGLMAGEVSKGVKDFIKD